jgi:hypothetical protein
MFDDLTIDPYHQTESPLGARKKERANELLQAAARARQQRKVQAWLECKTANTEGLLYECGRAIRDARAELAKLPVPSIPVPEAPTP